MPRPAIPGYGSAATGGDGGAVYYVTSGGDSGLSTQLRHFCEDVSGNRTILFDGVNSVTLAGNDTILFANGNVTISGATMGGVEIRGASFNADAGNVIIQGMMFRPGVNVDNMSSATIRSNSGAAKSHAWFDHCSFMWAEDQCFNIVGNVDHITVSHCIIAEGLFANQYNGLIYGPTGQNIPQYITFINNLFAYGKSPRCFPWITQAQYIEVINNYIFAPSLFRDTIRVGTIGSQTSGDDHPVFASLINNVLRSGPETSQDAGTSGTDGRRPIHCWNIGTSEADDQVYLNGNLVIDNAGNPVAEPHYWGFLNAQDVFGGGASSILASPTFGSGITPLPASEVEAHVLANVGATPPSLGFTRDPAEGRVVTGATNHTGGLKTDVADAGGYPTPPTPPSWTDTDGDGIPDSEEGTWSGDLAGYLGSFYDTGSAPGYEHPGDLTFSGGVATRLMSDYDEGGEGVGYHDLTTGIDSGANDAGRGGDVEFNSVGNWAYTATGEWLQFTIIVPAGGNYSLTFDAGAPAAGRALTLDFYRAPGGVQEGSPYETTGAVALTNTGSYSTLATNDAGTVTLEAGQNVMRATVTGNQTVRGFTLTEIIAAPVYDGLADDLVLTVDDAMTPVDMSAHFTGADSYASANLPAGLSIHSTTGVISGTPTASQAATQATVTATNTAGSTDASFAITIEDPAVAPVYDGLAEDLVLTIGLAVSVDMAANFTGATSYSATGLPTGLSINSGTGVISGTPTVLQAATPATVTATNAAGDTDAVFDISVEAAAAPGPVVLTASGQLLLTATGLPATAS